MNQLETLTGLDFFSNIPTNIQEVIEDYSGLVTIPITSPLLADKESISSSLNLVSSDSAIRHNSVTKGDHVSATSQVCTSQVCTSKISTVYSDRNQSSSTQIGIDQLGSVQVSAIQIGIPQINVSKVSGSQNSNLQINTTHISATQVDTTHIGSSKISTTQVSPTQVNIFQRSPFQINPTQINSTQISLPSSITLQQLLSSHNLPLEITNIFKNNPLNITLEITDLPTGQLAEAVVTHYTDQGIPNGGKIFIDRNANDVGSLTYKYSMLFVAQMGNNPDRKISLFCHSPNLRNNK